jgi:dolichyl-phosphate-mannose-protein mannosyltransferase
VEGIGLIAESAGPVETEDRHTGLSLRMARIRHGEVYLLGAFVLCITALNQLWLTQEHRPPHWDKARHLLASLQTKDAFGSGFHWLTDFHTYPPLVYWTAALFYGVLGTTASWAAVLSQSVFLGILTFSTYGIGERLWSRRVGLLSAVFVVLSPMLISLFKDFLLDPPLTAMTALALYLLIRCEYFSLRWPSVLLGLAYGLGLLTKWNFILYLALPIGYAVIFGGRHVSARVRDRVLNIGLAAAVAFAVAAPWYLANVSNLRQTSGGSNAADTLGIPPVLSVDGALWYFWNLVSNQLFLIPFLLLVVGVVFLFLRPDARSKNFLLILTIVGSYVLCSLLRLKDDRYTLPMLPAVAVVATYWLDGLRPRLRGWLVGGFLAYAFFTFAASSFGIGAPRDVFAHISKSCPSYPYFAGRCPGSHVVSGTFTIAPSGVVLTERGVRIWSDGGYWDGPPSGERWYQEQMFQEAKAAGASSIWFQGPPIDFPWFNGFAMYYFAYKYGITWVASPDQAQFAGIRTQPGEPAARPAGFDELRRYPMPDGGVLHLYRRGAGAAAGAGAGAPAKPTEPAAASLGDLRKAALQVGHPVMWAGKIPHRRVELTVEPDGSVYVRYLQPGRPAADATKALTVGTYPLQDAYAATRSTARDPNSVRIPIVGGIAFYNKLLPTSVYLAYPGSDVQVQVSSPTPGEARRLVASGAIRPAR